MYAQFVEVQASELTRSRNCVGPNLIHIAVWNLEERKKLPYSCVEFWWNNSREPTCGLLNLRVGFSAFTIWSRFDGWLKSWHCASPAELFSSDWKLILKLFCPIHQVPTMSSWAELTASDWCDLVLIHRPDTTKPRAIAARGLMEWG